jgi:intraflagellar transport protein 122
LTCTDRYAVLLQISDARSLAQLYVEAAKWDEAFELAKKHPELKPEVYVPYANHAAEHDRFEEAQNAFREAGHEEKAVEVLEVLTHNAVTESRFNDASYYFQQLASSVLQNIAKQSAEHGPDFAGRDALVARHAVFADKAVIYGAYHPVQRAVEEPFTSYVHAASCWALGAGR